MTPRIMYLHGLEGAPGSEKQKLLENVFGKRNVKSVNLKTRQTIMLFTLIFSAVIIIALCAFVACFVLTKWYISVTVTLVGAVHPQSFFMLCLILQLQLLRVCTQAALLACGYWVAGRGATHYMMRKAVANAEKKFKEFRPNVIVAETFGAVVALNMDVPKVAMLLLAPAQDQFARFMKLSYCSIGDYPYVMVVHGSMDKTVPLDDSIRLIETSEVGRCRLEVVDDGHSLKRLTEEDLKTWVEEVFNSGREQALQMARAGNKHVDPSLFGEPEEGDEYKPVNKETDV